MINNYILNLPITVHRDQDQKLPLLGALEKGCQYIEFDLHLVEGKLLIGHDKGLRNKTIQSVYLNPLQEIVNRGSLRNELALIVDIKTKAKETFLALQKVLKKYASMLTTYDEDTGLVQRDVKVIISGNRDRKSIAAARPRLAFYDGRITDLSGSLDANFMPMISEKWEKVILPPEMGLLEKLHYFMNYDDFVKKAIANAVITASRANIAFRPWAMPENEEIWEILAEFIGQGFVYNTDYPDRLEKFFEKWQDYISEKL